MSELPSEEIKIVKCPAGCGAEMDVTVDEDDEREDPTCVHLACMCRLYDLTEHVGMMHDEIACMEHQIEALTEEFLHMFHLPMPPNAHGQSKN